MKAKANFLGGLLYVFLTVYFAIFLARNSTVPQNIACWTMWALLDAFLVVTCFVAGNKRPWLQVGYTLGACLVVLILSSRGEWNWRVVETVSAIGAGIAIVSWWKLGPKYAIVAIILAMLISAIPAIYDAWVLSNSASWWYWGGTAICALLSFYGAKAWTIEDRLFPLTSFLFCLLMTSLELL